MATATASTRALQAVPAPAPDTAGRPDLRVVEPIEEVATRRSLGGLIGTFTVVLLFICIFGVVVFQVLLVQTQSQLDDLGAARSEQESRAKALDLETATLESPERIVAAALDLGMIDPDDREFLTPTDGDDRGAVYDPATEPVGTTPTTVAGATAATTGGTGAGTGTGSTTTGTTLPPTGVTLPPGPPYTAENNWGAGGPPTTPPVYGPENDWGADLTTGGASPR
jgi:cell division protein FtsL